MFRITPVVCILEEVDISYIFCFIFRDLLTFKVYTGAALNKEIKSEPSTKYGGISRPTLSEASAKGNYVKPHKIKKMSRVKMSTYAPSVVTTPQSVSLLPSKIHELTY